MATKNPAAKKRPGRPAIEQGKDTMPLSVRLTADQRAKLDRLGGPPWIREKIDKAKEPTSKE